MKKIYYSDQQIKSLTHNIIRQLNFSNWKPDLIVGLTRGGLVPSILLSHYLNVPMQSLNASFRDGGSVESNCVLAEEAFGYHKPRKNILIVDDINDSGHTLNWLIKDWQDNCLPNDPTWKDVWHKSVRFAVLIDNESSEFKNADYVGTSINKIVEPCWIVFPWENWWE